MNFYCDCGDCFGSGCRLGFEVTLVDQIGNEVQLDAAFIIVTILHVSHRPLSLIFSLILNKKVTWVGADHLLTWAHEPLMLYLSKLFKAVDEVILILLPLFRGAMFAHVLSDCITNLYYLIVYPQNA